MKYIYNYVGVYLDQKDLYKYASRYWDGDINSSSLTKSICRAMEDKECPFHIDPYESLVDKDLYDDDEDNMNENIKNNYWGRYKNIL